MQLKSHVVNIDNFRQKVKEIPMAFVLGGPAILQYFLIILRENVTIERKAL
jgi:hypothetical protein